MSSLLETLRVTVSARERGLHTKQDRSPLHNRGLPFWRAALLLTALLGASSPFAATIQTCGQPQLLANTVAAVLLWEDCGTGLWHMRATGGGSQLSITYEGTVVSDQPFNSVTPSQVESGDLLATPTNDQILYQFNVNRARVDGLEFLFPATANVCFSVNTPGARLLVGPQRTPVSQSLNLRTLGPCDSTPSCGNPNVDASTQSGRWLWQDCTTGNWEMRTTGGGSGSIVTYAGGISSDRVFTSVQPVGLERGATGSDSLTTPTTKSIAYRMNVIGAGVDGLRFSHPNAARVCVQGDGAGEIFYVGPTRTIAKTPFNLADLGACPSGTNTTTPPGSGGSTVPSGAWPYLDDGDPNDVAGTGPSVVANLGFPRIQAGQTLPRGETESNSKYDGVAIKGYDLAEVAAVQAINPDFLGLRLMSALAYQDFNNNNTCSTSQGIPFGGTGPLTQGCKVFAGHWLYRVGTKLTQGISANQTSMSVQNASSFSAGEYVVIYDAPAGSFNNAEHARITAVSRTTNTLTVARGYRSISTGHAAGAIVAAHTTGQGGDPRLWAWNQSSTCPRDGSGRQLNQVLADWLVANFDRDTNGQRVNGTIAGVLFDADFHFLDESQDVGADVDNDLVLDDGVSPSGVNYWGDGMEAFYKRVRTALPDILMVGGVAKAYGFGSNNGTQFEGFPADAPFETVNPTYNGFDGLLSRSNAHMHTGVYGPRYIETMFKNPTKTYPQGTNADSNAAFRLSFGMTLLEGGFFGQKRDKVADPWFDEFAVDVVPGSATFGQAIRSNPNNESLVRQHRHWLGMPLGPRYRIYDPVAFAPNRNLLSSGDFDSGTQGWSGFNVSVTQDTSPGGQLDGPGALRAFPPGKYTADIDGAQIDSPKVSLVKGREYTLVYSAKATEHRVIRPSVGGIGTRALVSDQWARFVTTFKPMRTGTQTVTFGVGRESTGIWFDSVYLFEGNANIFRRDFEGGIVVVNATDNPQTIDLGQVFQRIKGTGQDPVNDGARVRSVTIPAWDAAILVRIP